MPTTVTLVQYNTYRKKADTQTKQIETFDKFVEGDVNSIRTESERLTSLVKRNIVAISKVKQQQTIFEQIEHIVLSFFSFLEG